MANKLITYPCLLSACCKLQILVFSYSWPTCFVPGPQIKGGGGSSWSKIYNLVTSNLVSNKHWCFPSHLFCPGSFHELWIEYFLPSVQTLYISTIRKMACYFFPAICSNFIYQFLQLVILKQILDSTCFNWLFSKVGGLVFLENFEGGRAYWTGGLT